MAELEKSELISSENLETVNPQETEADALKSLETSGEVESKEENLEGEGKPKEKVELKSPELDEEGNEVKPSIKMADFAKEKSEDNTKKLEIKPSEVTPDGTKVKPQGRDYTGISDTDKPLFQKMGNESFTKMKEMYIESEKIKAKNAELENKLKTAGTGPQVTLNHPESYKLDPQYGTLIANYNLAQQIEDHWALQNARIRRGEKFQDLKGVDAKGNLVLDAEKEATTKDETEVQKWLIQAQKQTLRVESEHNTFVGGYQNKWKEAEDEVKLVEDKYLKEYTAPDHFTAPLQKQVIESIHPAYRDHPLARMVSRLTAALSVANNKLGEMSKKKAAENGTISDATKAQPKKKETVSGASRNGAIKMSDFQREKEEALNKY